MPPWLTKRKTLFLWLLVTVGIASYLTFVFFVKEDKTQLLPGVTTNGHYQIEQRCDVCHTEEAAIGQFTKSGVSNQACLSCHGAELELANDSHPVVKFRNPENMIFLDKIAADQCITCHTEHREDRTHAMAVTVPADYCAHCHEVTLENRESHKNLAFDSCATAGCHNFHDNLALFETFLVRHALEPGHLETQQVTGRESLYRWLRQAGKSRPAALTQAQADAPGDIAVSKELLSEWVETAHAKAGVNCADCHGANLAPNGDPAAWVDRPEMESCRTCHEIESTEFLQGKHGMRLAVELSPMRPGMARQVMHEDAAHRELSCVSCHGAHRFDRKYAAYEACVQCHDDEHTRNYQTSPHFALWTAETKGSADPGTGVSCATCHMPREERAGEAGSDVMVVVQHNQSANLKPNEKMIREVCMDCHGLGFTLDALADSEVIRTNFSQRPEVHVESIDWAFESAVKRKDPRALERLDESTQGAKAERKLAGEGSKNTNGEDGATE